MKSLCWPVFCAVSAKMPTLAMPSGLISNRRIHPVLIIAPPGGVRACMYCAKKAKGSSSFQAFHRPGVERLGPKHAPIVANNRDGENVPLTALGRTHISHEVFFMQPLMMSRMGVCAAFRRE